ncbi:MAG: hypothetical protein ACYDGR_01905 [Candidatus Dormibacteria bacterium]
MTTSFVVAVVLAAACGVLCAALYLAWPRRMTAEEWIHHRRAVSAVPLAGGLRRPPRLSRLPLWLTVDRYRAYLTGLTEDLALLGLAGGETVETPADLVRRLLGLGAGGAVGGAALGIVAWLAGGGPVGLVVVMAVLLGGGLPLFAWLRVRRRATAVRASVGRRLPRVLTGARMVLESGAATPERALAVAVGIYADPATQVLSEAMRIREVRRIPIEDALDSVAQRYRLPAIHRLADAFRVGGRYGTQMAETIAGFAQELRRSAHADFRERMTRAPVLMTLPALAFFVAPLLVLILFLVFAPLGQTLGQL